MVPPTQTVILSRSLEMIEEYISEDPEETLVSRWGPVWVNRFWNAMPVVDEYGPVMEQGQPYVDEVLSFRRRTGSITRPL